MAQQKEDIIECSACNEKLQVKVKFCPFCSEEYVDLNKATKNASLVLILCDHNEFKNLDYDLIKENMKNPIIFDTKNIIKKVPKDIKLYNYGNLFTL